ncbi:Peptide deformylase 1 [Pirellula sp. SH-Sr6A]|uniref:peptide deformylase n=1 Tax=Pirellula sp. SH-Sr6A TaxID=1632865 RepID=UPI00078D7067|nr:peptide deformylase [Pirellula sp. SH-Sr6A]AMV30981.1 Peptide deformylase 1 [Pirellula sp. SH-Sr6A]
MSKLQLVTYPHPILRHRSKPIQRVDAQFKDLIEQMFEIMYEFKGVGLAANQVNLPIRVFIANPTGDPDEKDQEMVFINPVINKPKGSVEAEEGCLSLPGINAQVKRSKSLQVNAYDLSGNEIAGEVDGFLARIIQHELDHLDGMLFIDRLADETLRPLIEDIAKLERRFIEGRELHQIPNDGELAEERTQWESKYC